MQTDLPQLSESNHQPKHIQDTISKLHQHGCDYLHSLGPAALQRPDGGAASEDPAVGNSHTNNILVSNSFHHAHTLENANVMKQLPSQTLAMRVLPPQVDYSPLSLTEILINIFSRLDYESLFKIGQASRFFHDLMTAPDVWRKAFSRTFPGHLTVKQRTKHPQLGEFITANSTHRFFCRLTPNAQWRDEYVLRAHLLTCARRGVEFPIYQPYFKINMRTIITHVDISAWIYSPKYAFCSWYNGECAIPNSSNAGLDARLFEPEYYCNLFPSESLYGLGSGRYSGFHNPMDVSADNGMLLGEGYPSGNVFHWGPGFADMVLDQAQDFDMSRFADSRQLCWPRLHDKSAAITAVWIAKTVNVPSLSGNVVGILVGDSLGVLSAHSLGTSPRRENTFARGETTARWVISPGVPIIAIAVDDQLTLQRKAQKKIWAVVLNALGELYYLTEFPCFTRAQNYIPSRCSAEVSAWQNGRSVFWNHIQLSGRIPRTILGQAPSVPQVPRSSWSGQCLTFDQIINEIAEIQTYLALAPSDFRKAFHGWDMERLLQVDFAGGDGDLFGEAIVVIAPGRGDDVKPSVTRFTRHKPENVSILQGNETKSNTPTSQDFCTSSCSTFVNESPSPIPTAQNQSLATDDWRLTKLSFRSFSNTEFTSVALDKSKIANQTISEDWLFTNEESASNTCVHPNVVPGRRARFFAAGTNNGSIFVWDIRHPLPKHSYTNFWLEPVRVIHTDSPIITSLGLNAFYLVHGGCDGLLQAWDPLGSQADCICTIFKRPSKRVASKLMVAKARALSSTSFPRVRNYRVLAVGTIWLDPDSAHLRGVATVGTICRSWNLGKAKLASKSKKNHTRRKSGNCISRETLSLSGLSAPNSVKHEMVESMLDDIQEERRLIHLEKRFGLGSLGEDEELRLAVVMSESLNSPSDPPQVEQLTSTPNPSMSEDADLAEALRRSLEDT